MNKRYELHLAILAFATIFSFATLDNAVSPLVQVLHEVFSVPASAILTLISTCTFGIVVGTLVGPFLISRYRIGTLLAASTILLVLSAVSFLFLRSLFPAQIVRLVFGLSNGVIASILWWLTFEGVKTEKGRDWMIVVMMSARPIAMALGVPAAAYLASITLWQFPFAAFSLLMLLSALLLAFLIPPKQEAFRRSPGAFFRDCREVFRVRYSIRYYLAVFLNSVGYFGFFSLGGIWFSTQYRLGTAEVSQIFFLIGLGEVIATVLAPRVLVWFAYRTVFMVSCVVSAVSFFIFIGTGLPLFLALPFMLLFLVFNKVYTFVTLQSLPIIFQNFGDKALLGSWRTVLAWLAFAVISGAQSALLPVIGVRANGYLLGIFIVLALTLGWIVQEKAVFPEMARRREAR